MTREEVIKKQLIDALDDLREIAADISNGRVEIQNDQGDAQYNAATAVGSVENLLSDSFGELT